MICRLYVQKLCNYGVNQVGAIIVYSTRIYCTGFQIVVNAAVKYVVVRLHKRIVIIS